MNNNLMNICYKGETGESDIRTTIISDILYISLKDILITLNKENREINSRYATKSMLGLIKAQLEALDVDEYKALDVNNGVFEGEKEIFVTQPGLYRVMSSDRSAAGKRFQKWLFHEVIPSLTRHGVYPAPPEAKGSAFAQMAEILAQNSRMLADTIVKHEKLAEDVLQVKGKVANVETRLTNLESNNQRNTNEFQTLEERLVFLDIKMNDNDLIEALAWCENISCSKARKVVRGDKRETTRFDVQTIDEAITIMKNKSALYHIDSSINN
ncbi:Bro-N domain-containing protein [Klebsiella pasteurii]|uniref:BRO-N domain-containing protein n=1 Tax=Klebsiella pasteurii TaxID=2587529 RepID=UPI001BA7E5C1|nr:BRO family protein [Klebsiella pasteurii]QUE95336.1 hypothetical protein KCG39_20775 [Klebsiella pasteurii]